MLAAEIASTTAKPSMILARNRRVGSLKDEPPRFKNRTSHPVFVLKNRHREALPPNPVRKVKAEWIRVRKFGQSGQRGECPSRLPSPRGGGSTRSGGVGWGDGLSASNSARVERSPHPVSHSASLYANRPSP